MRSNIITIGCRVSGKFGELIDPPGGSGVTTNPDGSAKKRRRVRAQILGTVVRSSGYRKWEFRFDTDNSVRVVSSHSLTVVQHADVGIPLGEKEATQQRRGNTTTTVSIFICVYVKSFLLYSNYINIISIFCIPSGIS